MILTLTILRNLIIEVSISIIQHFSMTLRFQILIMIITLTTMNICKNKLTMSTRLQTKRKKLGSYRMRKRCTSKNIRRSIGTWSGNITSSGIIMWIMNQSILGCLKDTTTWG